MKVYFLFTTTDFFNRHTSFGFASIAYLYREDIISPKNNTILVRAKDYMMAKTIIIATLYWDYEILGNVLNTL